MSLCAAYRTLMGFACCRQVQRVDRRRAILLVLCSSVLFVLASPGMDYSFLAWVALAPLLLALKNQSPLASFWLALSAGICANAGIGYWITTPTEVQAVDFLLMASYLGLYCGLFGVALTVLEKHSRLPLIVTAPVLWASLEYLRSNLFFLEFPWGLLAHTQYTNTTLIQIASITGVYGISYLIVMVNSMIADVLGGSRHAAKSALATLLALGVVFAFGEGQLAVPYERNSISVAVVPGHIPQGIRWDSTLLESNLRHYLTVTKQALDATHASMVVWPETSVPVALRRDLSTLKMLQDFVHETETPLLVGSADRGKFAQAASSPSQWFNSALLLTPGQHNIQPYHKIKLMPFGEYVPLKDVFPWPLRYRRQAGNLVAGKEYTIFSFSEVVEPVRFGVLICWESIFPNFVRQFVQRGAMFLVVMSNEAWFSTTSEPAQSLAMSVFRAVENHRAVVRAVNGGISGFIDPSGRITAAMDPEEANSSSGGFLAQAIPMVKSQTLYAVYGDVFAQSTAVAALALFLAPLLRRKRLILGAQEYASASHGGELLLRERAGCDKAKGVQGARRPDYPPIG